MGRALANSTRVGLIAALCVASIDAATGYIASGSRFHSVPFSVAGFALVALVALAVFLAVRWLAVAPLARRLPEDHAVSVATAMGVAALFVSHDVGSPLSGLSGLFDLAIDIVLGLVVGMGTFELSRNDARRPGMTSARVVGRALPFALPLAALTAWLAFVRVDDVTSVRFVLLIAGLIAGVGLIARGAAALTSARWRAGVVALGVVVALGGAASLAAIGSFGAVRAGTGKKQQGNIRHVIVLTVDTLRRDALSCYGSSTVRTPNIDAIAADGCRFANALSSSSWTLPSFASMMTGLAPREHGVVSSTTVLPDTVVTLAERFRDAGYVTKALVANSILAAHRGFAQGFARYHIDDTWAPPVNLGESLAARFRHRPLVQGATPEQLTDAAIAWLETRQDEDFFLWLHYLDPHLPYEPGEQYVERMPVHDEMGLALDISSATRPSMDLFGDPSRRVWARSLYDAEARGVDAQVGRLVAWLKAAGIYDETLIVFTADHGEEFWDHDGFEHGHTLYQELVAVPLIVKPAGRSGARVVDTPVSTGDVAPTVLEMCGLPPLGAPHAISLAAMAGGAAPPAGTRPLFMAGTLFRSNFESVVFDGWKYIRSATTGREELFRLADDPLERRSLALDEPAVAARGRALLDEHGRAARIFREDHGIENPAIDLDADEIARLRALGYL